MHASEKNFCSSENQKKSLNLGSPLNPLSIMSIHHCNLVFLLASVRWCFILLECRLSKPLLKYLCTLHLLILSLAQTSPMVILSFRGISRKASKSIGIGLRPTLPFFRLENTTRTELANCILPLCHMRCTVRTWRSN